MAVSFTGVVVAAVGGAVGGQLARIGARAHRRGTGPWRELTAFGRDLAQMAGIVLATMAGLWTAVAAVGLGVLLVIAGLICNDTFEEGPAQVWLAVCGVGAVVSIAAALTMWDRLVRRVRAAVWAEVDLGVPLLGPGRMLVLTTSVATIGCYAAAAGGTA